MIVVRCINGNWPAHQCNARRAEVECWLKEYVGERWKQWDWAASVYGYVIIGIDYPEQATAFKLKFGV